MVFGEEKSVLYLARQAYEPTKKGPLSFVLFESPFTSVSTVSRGHLSLVSLLGPAILHMPLSRTYLVVLSLFSNSKIRFRKVWISLASNHYLCFSSFFLQCEDWDVISRVIYTFVQYVFHLRSLMESVKHC
jgi:hypothetical protein